MKFRNKTTGEEFTIEEPAATIIKNLQAKVKMLEDKIDAYEKTRKRSLDNMPDFLKGFGK